MMTEKRSVPRRPVSLTVEFKVAEMELGQATWVESKGTIVDISEKGFGMITPHSLQEGQVIMIKKSKNNTEIPLFGLVKWIQKQNDYYRAGFGYKYET
jgi:hypothetical protein